MRRKLLIAGVSLLLSAAAPVPVAAPSDDVFPASESGDGDADASAALGARAAAIQAADYRGDRAELRRLAAALEQVTDPRLAAVRHYWRGFAHWRRALNGFSETPMPTDLVTDLEEAVRGFRAALAERPDWIEAKIGIVGSQGNLLFLAGGDGAAVQRILAEYIPVMREVTAQGADNPRALWLIGGTQLGAPPPHGGDAAKAAATFATGLQAARREARSSARPPAHAPSWGSAENLMSLAYLHSHSALEDRPLALAYARGALALVPNWHYVSEVLLPQIEALGSTRSARGQRLASVALRVHRLPAMVAFYSEAFGVQFREVDTRGIPSMFGRLGSVELRLVPIRDGTEFERFPIHQIGFEVPDVRAAVAAAERHGGRVHDPPARDGGRVRASVRDPDGNTVELDGPR